MAFLRFVLVVLILLPCAQAQLFRYVTSVAPLPDEDIKDPCRYELVIPRSDRPVNAVFVIFARSRDTVRIYDHLEVSAFSRRNQLALLMPYHCPPKDAVANHDDMNMDPARGLGRALFAALDQFAKLSSHPEISTSKLIFLGFSGTGSLVARLTAYAPDRVLASIAVAPGHFEPMGIDTVQLPPTAVGVPQLIIANSEDERVGTERPYQYFQKYRSQGAPRAFAIQNGVSHCCAVNAEPLMLAWLSAVIRQRRPLPNQALLPMKESGGWLAFMKTQQTDVKAFGYPTSALTDAIVEHANTLAPKGYLVAGWLPTRGVAQEWLRFVRETHHWVTPL